MASQMEMWPCQHPDCWDGKIMKPCSHCDGQGYGIDEGESWTCSECDGAGQVSVGSCSMCGGTGQITMALVRLYEAQRRVWAQHPEWAGDDKERPGCTDFSMAKYYRLRDGLHHGVVGVEGKPAGETGAAEVTLLIRIGPMRGLKTVTFHGFAWGYGGEGPRGLACVLADAMPQRFESVDAARRFLAGLDIGQPWKLGREVLS